MFARGGIFRVLLLTLCAVLSIVAVQRAGSAQTSFTSELVGRVGQIASEVSRLRGLSFRRPFCHRLANEGEMTQLLRSRVRSQYSPGELQREGQLLAMLGLVSTPASYESRVYELLGETIAGMYDPGTECLYIARWIPWEEQVDTLYHETAHALQDQHFDLDRLLEHRLGASDRLAAASAVTEGDATAVAMMASDGSMASATSVRELRAALLQPTRSVLNDALRDYVRRVVAFSYADGLDRVRVAYGESGWRGVDNLLLNPPTSTEEVLHPERARAGDATVAVSISIPVQMPESCNVVHEDTLGEMMLRTVLERYLPDAEAAASVEGWGGDRAMLLDSCPRAGQQTLIVSTVWDEETGHPTAPAERFFSAMSQALRARHGAAPRRDGTSTATFELGHGQCSILSRRGRAVVYLEGVGCDLWSQIGAEI